jgi:hypothetical protein
MDLKSCSRWYDYCRSRDAIVAATNTARAPWYIARTDDKQRGRLNLISHLLTQVPYKPLAQRDVTLPRRQRAGGYVERDPPMRHIPHTVLNGTGARRVQGGTADEQRDVLEEDAERHRGSDHNQVPDPQ